MTNCVIFFSEKRRLLKKLTLKWFSLADGGFYVLYLPYTKYEYFKNQKKIEKRIYKFLYRSTAYVIVPQCRTLEHALSAYGLNIVDGTITYCKFMYDMIEKEMNKKNRKYCEVGIYDKDFTNCCVDILSELCDICRNLRIFTDDTENAKNYAELIYSGSGTPITVSKWVSGTDITILLSKVDKPSIRGLAFDVYGENEQLTSRCVSHMYLAARNELADAYSVFESIDTHIADFLSISGISVDAEKNLYLTGYR